MVEPSSDRLRRPLLVGIGASLLFHAILVALIVLGPGWGGVLPRVKRGEPLFVELPNIAEPAPRGNPAAREPGSPAPAPAAPAVPAVPPSPSRPASPSTPSPRSPAKAPAVAKVAPAPPVPEKSPARAPERTAAPPPRDLAPAPTPAPEPRVADAAPSPKEPAPSPAPVASAPAPTSTPAPPAQEARTPPGDGRTAMVPSPGSAGSSGAPDMRTSLRRGTAPGGTSDGRGGIEGEPIPLDSRDPRYSDYLDRIRRMIKDKWGYPCVKNGSTHECEYKTALLVIEFGIARDGKVPFVNVLRTSGFQIYDDYAVNAIKFAQPFPRVPDTMGSRSGVPIVATFSYQVDTSLVNLLR
jgi:TonB family protein